LDEWHGFHPYTMWSTTTPANAIKLLVEAGFAGEVEVTGIVRAYGTRHGAGPFVTEMKELENIHPGEHNCTGDWQGSFRFGAFDGVMLRYAIDCVRAYAPAVSIALTHLDIADKMAVPYCDQYLVPKGLDDSMLGVTEETADGLLVSDLRLQFNQDLAYQERMTNLLQKAALGRKGQFRNSSDVIDYIEGVTGARISYTSF